MRVRTRRQGERSPDVDRSSPVLSAQPGTQKQALVARSPATQKPSDPDTLRLRYPATQTPKPLGNQLHREVSPGVQSPTGMAPRAQPGFTLGGAGSVPHGQISKCPAQRGGASSGSHLVRFVTGVACRQFRLAGWIAGSAAQDRPNPPGSAPTQQPHTTPPETTWMRSAGPCRVSEHQSPWDQSTNSDGPSDDATERPIVCAHAGALARWATERAVTDELSGPQWLRRSSTYRRGRTKCSSRDMVIGQRTPTSRLAVRHGCLRRGDLDGCSVSKLIKERARQRERIFSEQTRRFRSCMGCARCSTASETAQSTLRSRNTTSFNLAEAARISARSSR